MNAFKVDEMSSKLLTNRDIVFWHFDKNNYSTCTQNTILSRIIGSQNNVGKHLFYPFANI